MPRSPPLQSNLAFSLGQHPIPWILFVADENRRLHSKSRWHGPFSTAFHRKISQSCDDQPLPRILVVVPFDKRHHYQNSRKRTLGGMHQSSTKPFPASSPRGAPTHSPNSLFQNILALTPYGSIFCAGSPLPTARKPLPMSILQRAAKKY